MRIRIESAANWATVILCATVTGMLLLKYFQERAVLQEFSDRRGAQTYGVGDRATGLEQIDLSSAPRTVLLIVRSTCKFCTASMPFYRRLVAERAPGIRIVGAVTADSVDQGKAYFAQHGVEPDEIIPYPPQSTPEIRGTPTLLIVDPNAEIRGLWTGRLDESQEQAVLSLVSQRASAQGGASR